MKSKRRQKNVSKTGLPHGSSVYIGPERNHDVAINLISYNEKDCIEIENASLNDLSSINLNYNHWIHVNGVYNVNLVHNICRLFNVFALTEEDILNTLSRPK